MTELNIAYSYGNNDDTQSFQENDMQQIQQSSQQSPQIQQSSQQQQIKKELEIPKPAPVYQQSIPQQQYYQTPPQPKQQYRQNRNPEYSFWDRMVMSRTDVIKLFILSVVIILGISLEKIGYYYVSSYISDNSLTSIQELLVRLSFPVIVFILLWIIKSL